MSDRYPTNSLIVIAGAIGSGKSTVAQAVAQRLAVPVYSIDDDKRDVGKDHKEFPQWIAQGIPFPDDFRRKVYETALKGLAELAQSHQRVIVEETFHMAKLREPFFEAAKQHFAEICVIEIVVAPEVAIAHLEKRSRDEANHMAGRAMFEAFAALADPIDNADLVVDNNGDITSAVDQICLHLEKAG